MLIRKLVRAVNRIPDGYVLTDEDTGELLTLERERGSLTLAVSGPPLAGAGPVVARYMLGSSPLPLRYALCYQTAAPSRPPLYRHPAALGDIPPAAGDGRNGRNWSISTARPRASR